MLIHLELMRSTIHIGFSVVITSHLMDHMQEYFDAFIHQIEIRG